MINRKKLQAKRDELASWKYSNESPSNLRRKIANKECIRVLDIILDCLHHEQCDCPACPGIEPTSECNHHHIEYGRCVRGCFDKPTPEEPASGEYPAYGKLAEERDKLREALEKIHKYGLGIHDCPYCETNSKPYEIARQALKPASGECTHAFDESGEDCPNCYHDSSCATNAVGAVDEAEAMGCTCKPASDHRDICPYCEGDRNIGNCSHSDVEPATEQSIWEPKD